MESEARLKATDERQPAYPGTPRWVKISGIIVGILALLVVVMAVAGGGRHSPFRHFSSGADDGARPPILSATEIELAVHTLPKHDPR